MCYSHVLAVACAIAATAATADTKSVEIPLKEIWALNSPQSRNLRKLDPPREQEPQTVADFMQGSVVEMTLRELGSHNWPKDEAGAGRGFVVVGKDLDALREAQSVLTNKSERADFLPAGKNLTLVFYAYSNARYVFLDGVEHDGNTIKVRYHFEAHRTLDMHPQLALIPLGELSSGKKRVQIVRLPDIGPGSEAQTMERGETRKIVCESFSFGVAAMKE